LINQIVSVKFIYHIYHEYRYNIERGYGFIARDDGEADMYVHATGLLTDEPIKEGDHVQFATEIDRRTNKPKAVSVELTGKASPAPKAAEAKPAAAKKKAPAPNAELKKSSIYPNQRALLTAKLQNDQAAKAHAKMAKSLQDEKLHRSLLAAKLKNDESSKETRIAAQAEQARLAKEAEEKRIADEKAKAAAEEACIAAEAEQARLAKEAEEKRLAEEAEKKRLVEEAEKARIAAEAEKARLAKEAEEKRIAEEKAKAAAAEEAALKQKALELGCDDIETYKARTAHWDKDEDAKLAAKYSVIPDLGERLFTILVDLNMVELHLDPNDPNVVIEDDDDE
jgi:cold shock CspA family protein